MDTIASLTDTLLLRLAWTSIQASLLIALLWLLGRALPRLPTPTRCLLWWLLGVQLLVGLAWQAPVALPLLPPAQVAASTAHVPPALRIDAQKTPAASTVVNTGTNASGVRPALAWRQALAALWLAGLLVQLALVARQWQRTRRIRRLSTLLDDPRMRAWCAEQAARLGLRHCPQLRVCDAIDSPQVTGLWRAVVLLPARQALAPEEQAMALAHELAHVRRGDLWLGWIPALAKGLFFFHPLVRLAVREYTLHREAACDDQALRLQGTPRHAYGQLLLRLGVERPAPAGLTSVASPSFRQLQRRLAMLQHAAGTMPRVRDWMLVAAVTLAFVIPYRLVSAHPASQSDGTGRTAADRTTMTADHAAFAPPVGPAVATTAQSASTPGSATNGCVGAGLQNVRFCGAKALFYAQSAVRDQSVILFDRHYVVIHGTDPDIDAARPFYKPGASVLWFRRGDQSYVSRDKRIVEQAWKIYAPLVDREHEFQSSQISALAQKQAALVKQRMALVQEQLRLTGESLQFAGQPVDARAQSRIRALRAQQQALQADGQRLAQQQTTLESRLEAAKRAQKAREAFATQHATSAASTGEPIRRLIDEALARGLARQVHQG